MTINIIHEIFDMPKTYDSSDIIVKGNNYTLYSFFHDQGFVPFNFFNKGSNEPIFVAY